MLAFILLYSIACVLSFVSGYFIGINSNRITKRDVSRLDKNSITGMTTHDLR